MITLCDDMLTVKTDAVRIIPEKVKGTTFEGHGFFEGSSIRKIKRYILFYIFLTKKIMSCATPRVNIPTEISNTAEQLFKR